MELYGKTELNSTESTDSLEFTVVHKSGLVEVILGPLVTVFVVWLLWRAGSPWTKIMAALAGVSCTIAILTNRRQGESVTLRVTAQELATCGNMGKLFETEQRIASEDVQGMAYRMGGEGDLFGLYAKLRWNERCILPRLSEEQTREVIDLIGRKFPDLPTSDVGFPSLGGGDQLTTLGLAECGKNEEGKGDRIR